MDIYEANGRKNFFENGYELTLENGMKPLKVTKLKKEDLVGLMRENATQWGEYYWVEFPRQNKRTQERITLILSHKDFGKNTLQFGFRKIKRL